MKANIMVAASKKSVFGVASSHFEADRIVNHLADAGFSRNSISVVVPGKSARRDACKRGWMSGSDVSAGDGGQLAPPRFDPFMAGGSLTGGVLGVAAVAPASLKPGTARACSGADDPVLICLRANAWREAEAARKIFQAMGASNISLGCEEAFRLLAETFQQYDAAPEFSAWPSWGINQGPNPYEQTPKRNQRQHSRPR
jgi:hypothetical protein